MNRFDLVLASARFWPRRLFSVAILAQMVMVQAWSVGASAEASYSPPASITILTYGSALFALHLMGRDADARFFATKFAEAGVSLTSDLPLTVESNVLIVGEGQQTKRMKINGGKLFYQGQYV